MATITFPYHRSTQRPQIEGDRNRVGFRLGSWLHVHWAKLSPAAYVLVMFGYFLLLGSIAVVVITKQFPWFTIAPITILLAVAYIRHVEKNELRRLSQDGPHS